jgi:hypothetical protein
MRIDYARVSTTEQNLGLQPDDLKPAYDASVDQTEALCVDFCRGLSGSFTSRQDEGLRKTEPSAVLLRPHPRGLVVPIAPHLTRFLDLAIVDVRDNRCVLADPSHLGVSHIQVRISSPLHRRDGQRFVVASAARRVDVEEVVGQ